MQAFLTMLSLGMKTRFSTSVDSMADDGVLMGVSSVIGLNWRVWLWTALTCH
jgi:hypothetical protein